MVARSWGVLNRHRGFKNIGLPFTVENSTDNNPIQTTHSESVHTTCIMSNPLLQNIRGLLDPMNCTMWNLRNCEGRPGQCGTLIGSQRVLVQKNRAIDSHYDSNNDSNNRWTSKHNNIVSHGEMGTEEKVISYQRASNKGVKILNRCFPS